MLKYHLHKVFTKLGISSRGQLHRILPADPAAPGQAKRIRPAGIAGPHAAIGHPDSRAYPLATCTVPLVDATPALPARR